LWNLKTAGYSISLFSANCNTSGNEEADRLAKYGFMDCLCACDDDTVLYTNLMQKIGEPVLPSSVRDTLAQKNWNEA
jgi:hypothetical protein